MSDFKSITGQVLWQWLPEVYRNLDETGEFAALFDSLGYLLDSVRATQDQRLADCFPDNPSDPMQRACQDWLLPYFAKLLDANLVSPHVKGRRDEVANAIYWRQRKGTYQGVESIAECISQKEFIVHEGYKRVVTTPRIDIPYLDPKVLGYPEKNNLNNDPSSKAKNPALPHATIDFRYSCRSQNVADINHAPYISKFDHVKMGWKYTDPQGSPCFIDSYEDYAPRTVDFRDPQWNHGWHHPKRILLFTPPETGIFNDANINSNWDNRSLNIDLFREYRIDDELFLLNPSMLNVKGTKYEDCDRLNFITAPDESDYSTYSKIYMDGMNFSTDLTLRTQTIVLENMAIKNLTLKKIASKKLKLIARNCLFEDLDISNGEAELEYCTVMNSLKVKVLNASDCIFNGEVIFNGSEKRCVRYSRVPVNIDIPESMMPPESNNTSDMPIFYDGYIGNVKQTVFCDAENNTVENISFGSRCYGVLHAATPQSISQGSEDGGEMGVFHDQYHRQQINAILNKYNDYLPVDMEPVIIEDYRLLRKPIITT